MALFALRPPRFQRLPPLKPPWGHDFRPLACSCLLARACLLVLACSCLCLLACACLLVLACSCFPLLGHLKRVNVNVKVTPNPPRPHPHGGGAARPPSPTPTSTGGKPFCGSSPAPFWCWLARACLPIVLFATELAGIERQALPGAGGVATGIGVSDSLAAGSLAAGSLVFSQPAPSPLPPPIRGKTLLWLEPCSFLVLACSCLLAYSAFRY